jgi:hypothetical protein
LLVIDDMRGGERKGRTEEKTLPEFEQVDEGEVCSGAEEEG